MFHVKHQAYALRNERFARSPVRPSIRGMKRLCGMKNPCPEKAEADADADAEADVEGEGLCASASPAVFSSGFFRLIFRLPAWGLRLRSDLGGESPGIGERR